MLDYNEDQVETEKSENDLQYQKFYSVLRPDIVREGQAKNKNDSDSQPSDGIIEPTNYARAE